METNKFQTKQSKPSVSVTETHVTPTSDQCHWIICVFESLALISAKFVHCIQISVFYMYLKSTFFLKTELVFNSFSAPRVYSFSF